jgi:hypothetical protein
MLFVPIFWARGEVRIAGFGVQSELVKQFAFVLCFGIVGQHFFLDQYIWRRKGPALEN